MSRHNTTNQTQLTYFRAGGIISETSFKFFIQFLVYAALYCVFCLIVSAYYTAKAHAHLFRDGAPLIATIALYVN